MGISDCAIFCKSFIIIEPSNFPSLFLLNENSTFAIFDNSDINRNKPLESFDVIKITHSPLLSIPFLFSFVDGTLWGENVVFLKRIEVYSH